MEIHISVGLIICLASLILLLGLQRKRPKNYPPGPFPLPIIGNLHNLGTQPFKTFMQMKAKYGPVFAIELGPNPAIILNDHKLIKKYLNMSQTTGRPRLLPFTDKLGDEIPRGIGSTDGDVWIEQRRFALRNLRDFGFGKKSMETLISEEAGKLIESLKKNIGKPIETQDIFCRAVVNSLYTICTGERASESDKEFESILKSIGFLARNLRVDGVALLFPKLCKLFPVLSGYKNLMSWSVPMLNSLRLKVEEHKITFDPNHKRDLIDCYISEINNNTTSSKSAFRFHNKTEAELHTLVALQDLFMAGSETVRPVPVLLLEKSSWMPYFQALIMETLRYSTLLPFGMMHSTVESLEIEGYTIPKGTMLIPNLYGAHHDPEVWGPNAGEIEPGRFLSKDNSGAIVNYDAFMPFSIGKRMCIGDGLTKDSLFLFTISIFQQFRVGTNPNGPKPTLEYHVGFTLSPKKHQLILYER